MDITAVKEALIALKQKVSDSSSSENFDKRKIKLALKKIKKETLPLFESNEERALWLCDNYYMVCREAKLTLKSPIKLSRRLALFIGALLEGIDCKADAKTAEVFYDIFADCLTDEEIEAVGEAMKCQLIILLGKNISDPELVKNCIVSLRFVSTLDITPYILGFSKTERILRTDSIYPLMDKATQNIYKSRIKKLAKKEKLPPCELCRNIIQKASAEGRHIGEYLIKKPSELAVFFYFCATALLYGIFTGIFSSLFFAVVPKFTAWVFTLLSLLPLYVCTREAINALCPFFTKAERIPKLKLDKIPAEYTTLAVVTQLLATRDDAGDAAEHIEKIYLTSRRGAENLFVGLLCDLPEASSAKKPGDEEIISLLYDRIESLNLKYGNKFYLFIRRRKYNRREGIYMAYERKRGAILDLVSFIKGRGEIEEFIGDREALCRVRYIITLDSDTDMGIDVALKLVGAMAHPLNRPVVEAGRVVSGYGIMQPLITTCLESAYSTPFSLLLSGAAGTEPYMGAQYDVYQTVFGRGLFCGKGIFDVDCFDKVLSDAFPDNTVLSHDIPEGMRLSCAFLGDVALCDGMPKNALSYFKREHRWIRGDTQALAFAGRRVKNKKGQWIKNPIDALSRFILYDNFLRHISPVFSALLIILSAPFTPYAALAATLPILTPFIFQVLFCLVSKKGYQPLFRQFFSNAITNLWRGMLLLFYNVSSLAHRAYINCDAVLRALWRMKVSGKKMLEWSTASESDKRSGGGLGMWISKMEFSVIAGIAIIILSKNGLHRLCGILFLIYPLIGYLSSIPYTKKKNVTDAQIENVGEYVAHMWSFFDDYVTAEDNFLPPDNISVSPVEAVAHRTSPTNIGLYLLSLLAARDFEIIDSSELYRRLNLTLQTVESMEKFKGHLYNWYDTSTLSVIGGGYISTVDSGNFVTSLVALCEGLKEYVSEEPRLLDLIVRAGKISDDADFRVLYNSKRELFFLGSDGEKCDSICYDLYMSEARTTSYYAIAKGHVTKSHWGTLGRTLLKKNFHLGAASWSGTAFEYFMPPLLLPVYENSFESESLRFAYAQQKSYGEDGIWGISESQFFAFDNRMNYMYKAFGIPALRLARGKGEKVISPYSVFLMMKIDLDACLENLKKMKKLGIYGKYGFYEAVDFDTSRTAGMAIVKSYMSHHLGMSIVAAANAVKDDIFVRRFMANPYMKSADELLKEKIPTDAIVYNNVEPALPAKETGFREEDTREVTLIDVTYPTPALLYGKDSYLLSLDNGISSFAVKQKGGCEILINRPFSDTLDFASGIIAFAKPSGESTLSNLAADDTKSFIYSDSFCEYKAVSGKNTLDIKYSPASASCALNIKVSLKNKSGREDSVGIYFEPCLAGEAEYKSHPAYSALFCQAEFEGECLIISRGKSYIAVGASAPFEFETRKETLFERRFSTDRLKDIINSTDPLSGNLGACISPAVMLRCAVHSASFTIAYGKTRGEALAAFTAARREADGRVPRSLMSLSALDTKCDTVMRENLLRFALPAETRQKGEEVQYKRDDLYKLGISGDLPIITIRLFPRGEEPDDGIFEKVEQVIATFKLHSVIGFKYDLVMLIDEPQKNYSRPYTARLSEIIGKCKCDYLLGAKGGIFVVCADENFEGRLYMFERISSAFIKDLRELFTEAPDKKAFRRIKVEDSLTVFSENPLFALPSGTKIRQGFFYDEGFLIDKKVYAPKISWSHIIASCTFGTLINDTSLGYTWFSNSRERRLTRWENSSTSTFDSEKLYLKLKSDGKIYDLCALSDKVFYGCGFAEYYGCIQNKIFYNISVTAHPKLLFKAVRIKFSSDFPSTAVLYYNAKPVMGDFPSKLSSLKVSEEENTLTFKNIINDLFYGGSGFLSAPFEKKVKKITSAGEFEGAPRSCGAPVVSIGIPLDLSQNSEKLFLLGHRGSDEHFRRIKNYILKTPFDKIKEQMAESVFEVMPKNQKALGFPLDELYSFWLPYQSIVGRFMARSGAYQSSGAYGFRDQLQDALIFAHSSPNMLRRQIFRSAAHQFEEGDVMHWWHNVNCRGVRSMCSDDYLWLPYAVERYIDATGDLDILERKIHYITAPSLGVKEKERYGEAKISPVKESLLLHCKRALDLFISRGFGSHGLPYMGSCDWNDGMSEVGNGGGESVWLAFFARIVLYRFALLCERVGESGEKYKEACFALRESIEKNCYFDGYYARAFFGDGTPMGVKESRSGEKECEIDLLPQAFASICHKVIGDGDPERITSALNCAYSRLYDKKRGVLKLFTPAFSKTPREVGYIKNYPVGLRENGGQYTHGAVWGAFGFLYAPDEINRQRGREIAESLSPACVKRRDVYLTEPYVLTGDVYTNPEHIGRGGWSWYTGAAHWYYKLLGQI